MPTTFFCYITKSCDKKNCRENIGKNYSFYYLEYHNLNLNIKILYSEQIANLIIAHFISEKKICALVSYFKKESVSLLAKKSCLVAFSYFMSEKILNSTHM